MIEAANKIIEAYQAQGFDLTLRQLYYQFVSHNLLANNQRNYDNLGSLISDARLAGYIDWEAIQDRTRNLRSNPHWKNAGEILESCAAQYRQDEWAGQKYRPEVWIEKDALVGVIADICGRLDIPYFSCRGYTSQSEMWKAAQRLEGYIEKKQIPLILHFGDHDPSGIDMSRDIQDRLGLFISQDTGIGNPFAFRRLALNKEQIQKFKLPPNPAKLSDSRSGKYIEKYGRDSWELDALEPSFLVKIIDAAIWLNVDSGKFDKIERKEKSIRKKLKKIAKNWDAIK